MRPNGYYWVKVQGTWTIGRWYYFASINRGIWLLYGDTISYDDKDFSEINPKQLEAPK